LDGSEAGCETAPAWPFAEDEEEVEEVEAEEDEP
jgi:hypothetical protein